MMYWAPPRSELEGLYLAATSIAKHHELALPPCKRVVNGVRGILRAMRDLAIAAGTVDVRGRQRRPEMPAKATKPRRRPYQWRPMYEPPLGPR